MIAGFGLEVSKSKTMLAYSPSLLYCIFEVCLKPSLTVDYFYFILRLNYASIGSFFVSW